MPLDINPPGGGGTGTPYASTPANVASSGKAGASSDYARGDHVHAGVASVAATGKAGITGAATMSAGKGIALTQVSNDIEIALSGSSGGPPAALVWDTTQATDATKGRYATMAEIATAIGTAESPVEVDIVGAALANAAGTYEWANVHFRTSKAGTTLVGSEGVVIRNASFSGPLQISSNATSTRFLTYTAERVARFDGPTLTGSATKGLITTNNAGAQVFRFSGGATLNARTFEQTVAAAAEFHTDDVTYAGSNQFLGSLGTLEFLKTANTVGTPELSSWSGALPDYGATGGGALRPAVDADVQVRFAMDDAVGTTSITDPITGAVLTFTGASALFGASDAFGDTAIVDGVFDGVGVAKTMTPASTNITLEAWVTLESPPVPGGSADNTIVCKGSTGAGEHTFAIGIDCTGTDAFALARIKAGGVQVSVPFALIMYGKRHYLVVTYDGANVRSYVDGILATATARTGTLDYDATKSIKVGNEGSDTLGLRLSEIRISDVVHSTARIKADYVTGAFTGGATTDATTLRGVPIAATAPAAGEALVYDGAEWTPTTQPTRGVVASLEWTAAAGVYTQVSAENIAGVVGYDYGSGTNSLKITLTNAVTNGVGISQTDPDWVGAFHVDSTGPVMISGTEVRIDFRDKADTQVSPANGAGVFTLIGDL